MIMKKTAQRTQAILQTKILQRMPARVRQRIQAKIPVRIHLVKTLPIVDK